jgi:hypothetical protein
MCSEVKVIFRLLAIFGALRGGCEAQMVFGMLDGPRRQERGDDESESNKQ